MKTLRSKLTQLAVAVAPAAVLAVSFAGSKFP